MTILSAQTIRQLCIECNMILPFCERTQWSRPNDLLTFSYGLSSNGYDVRASQEIFSLKKGEFSLNSTIEKFHMPNNIAAIVHDKSTWARKGLSVFNTVIEAGWSGWLTLELANHSDEDLFIPKGVPIAQIIFHRLDEATEQSYNGKYQGQGMLPQPAI